MSLRYLGVSVLLAAAAPPAPTAYDSPQAGFTFVIPAGWEMKVEKTEPLPVVYGPKDDPGAPYLVVHQLDGTKDFIELTNTTVRDTISELNFQLSSRDAFRTADKKDGYKYVFQTPNDPPYREVYYFVEGGPGRNFVLIAVVPAAGWQKYGPMLDRLIETFRLKPTMPAATPSSPSAATPSPTKPPAPPIMHGGGR